MSSKVHSIVDIYHEKQTRELCALHSLNNLFQDASAFSKSELDKICQRLSPNNWVNPHRSVLGTGNYDINVIMAALETKGCTAIWFDKRKDPGTIGVDLVLGFILNIPLEYRFGPVSLPVKRKHWVAIKQINGAFYNLDSKLDAPYIIGQKAEVIDYLRSELSTNDKELFVIVHEDSCKSSSSWSVDLKEAANGVTDSLNALPCDPEKQKRMLASIEGEDAFTAPGLKYIDYDALSIEKSTDLENHKNKEVTR